MALLLALYAGGQRMAQLLRAKVGDFDQDTATLRLWDGKGKRTQPREHLLPLSLSYPQQGDCYLADLWYYPNGPEPDAEPLVIDLQAREIGYYHVPSYMASEAGDLTYQVPLRSLIAIDSWVHVFIADMIFGLFGRGARFEDRLNRDPLFKLRIFGKSLYEGRQVLESSGVVQIGHNCVIDPTAIIHGPTSIGSNVTIGAGAGNQTVKAIGIAGGYVAPGGIDLVAIPAFLDIEVGGEERTAIRFIIEPR